MTEQKTRRMKAKVCLVGESAVGKTSLIRRFVLDEFDDKYMTTLGAKVSKRTETFGGEGPEIEMDMTIWDIMGAKGFRELLKEAFFHGAQGVIAVADVTRGRTLQELDDWVHSVFGVVGEVPVIYAINKADRKAEAAFEARDVEVHANAFGAPYLMTSAKTGENVEKAFGLLARAISAKVEA